MQSIQRAVDVNPFVYTYLLSGERAKLQSSNGSEVAYTSDNLGRLLTLTNSDPAGGLVSSYAYGYDSDWASGQYTRKGLAVSMSEELPGSAATIEKYYFDTLYRLTRADYADGSHNEWNYDPMGNRLSAATYPAQGEPAIRNYTWYPNGHGGNSQLLESDGVNTYSWDANGNMLSKTTPDGISYYTWDSLNRLKTITAPYLNARYTYDFSNVRTRKTVNSTESVYQYTGWDLVSETTADHTSEYVFGADIDEILNMRMGGADYWYYTDRLGSVRQIQDSTGTLANSHSYDAWGEIRLQQVTIPNVFLYTGREGGEDGLFYFRKRYYHSATGQFISEDPRPSYSRELFSYALANPTLNTDPFGESAIVKLLQLLKVPLSSEVASELAVKEKWASAILSTILGELGVYPGCLDFLESGWMNLGASSQYALAARGTYIAIGATAGAGVEVALPIIFAGLAGWELGRALDKAYQHITGANLGIQAYDAYEQLRDMISYPDAYLPRTVQMTMGVGRMSH